MVSRKLPERSSRNLATFAATCEHKKICKTSVSSILFPQEVEAAPDRQRNGPRGYSKLGVT